MTAPESRPHPLLDRTPHPRAALVAMAFEAAGITRMPGATDLQYCPELLWGNVKYWTESIAPLVRLWSLVRDDEARAPRPVAKRIEPLTDDDSPVPDATGNARRRRASRRRAR
ncbi:MAG: hypothetical protein NZ898_00995 [Myxococcota bacterium]|nr:hypothetical protein [Myxococcota bacterium]MDW8360829.1 hypothetical protein [Myxococcales bacterium]